MMLPIMTAQRRNFAETKYISFRKNEELLENYNEILYKVGNSIKKGFDGKPVYNEKYVKNKIKFYEGKSTHIFMTIMPQKKVLNTFVNR